MYEAFYGLSGKPFQLNPDPAFYFGSRQHRRALAYLEYGLHQNEGFIVVTGEVGAGKTTLVRHLFGKLDSSKVIAANLVSTQLEADDLLRMVAAAFGVGSPGAGKSELLLAIEGFLVSAATQGKRCLLVVDEAQNLALRAVEELRMLSNLQLKTNALLQSFLIGQPEFRAILHGPAMEQLRQRVIAACHIGPMDAAETRAYIEHRLRRVGWNGSPRFHADAFPALFEASGGIPRRINAVCDRLLLSGFLAEKRDFGRDEVNEVAEELALETQGAKLQMGQALAGAASALSSGEVELLGQQLGGQAVEEAQRLVASMSRDDLIARLVQLEGSMIRLERTMLRLQGSNAASLMLLGQFMDRLRSAAAVRGDGNPK